MYVAAEVPAASPSSPSVKLTPLLIAAKQKAVKGKYQFPRYHSPNGGSKGTKHFLQSHKSNHKSHRSEFLCPMYLPKLESSTICMVCSRVKTMASQLQPKGTYHLMDLNHIIHRGNLCSTWLTKLQKF